MFDLPQEDLTVLALADDDGESEGAGYSAMELGDRLEMGSETFADRISLLSALAELEAEGMVEKHTDGKQSTYRLTDPGRRRVTALYEDLQERRISVKNGTTEEIPLADVDEYLPDPSVPRALVRMTDDGVLYLDAAVDQEFVNRRDELATLSECFDSAAAGNGNSVLITGKAGIGKTSLQEEALDRFAGEYCVLRGVARGDTDQPYQVVREAIESELEESPFDRPDLAIDEPEDLAHLRTSLFADVADALLGLAKHWGVVVLALDDLHNADEGTIDLIEFLSRRLTTGSILMVLSSRLNDVDDDHPVSALAAGWKQREFRSHLALSPFDPEATRALIEVTLDTRRLPAAFVDLVYEWTGGTPLFVTETCSQMQEENVLVPSHDIFPTEPEAVATSRTVEETIDTRLHSLDDTGEALLSTAGVLGEEFSADLLERAHPADSETIGEYVDLFVDTEILSRDEERLRFRSGLFRETLVDRIPPDVRREYHHRIVEALETQHGTDPEVAATIAYHYERGGNERRALEAWLRAAEYAESVYALEVARTHYERALAIARDLDESGQVLDILEAIGDLSLLLGDHEEARRAFEYVRSEVDGHRRRLYASRRIGRQQLEWEGDPETALETFGEALASVEAKFEAKAETEAEIEGEAEIEDHKAVQATEDGEANALELVESGNDANLAGRVDAEVLPEVCQILVQRGRALGHLGDFDASFDSIETAIDAGEAVDNPTVRGEAMIELVGQQAMKHEADERTLEYASDAVEIFESIDDERNLAGAYMVSGLSRDALGYQEEATRHYHRAQEVYGEIGDRRGALVAQYNLATRSTRQYMNGDHPLDETIEEVNAVIEEARALENERGLGYAIALRGGIAWHGEYDYTGAIDYIEEALAISRRIEEARMMLTGAFVLGWIHLTAGEYEQARSLADEAVELAREAPVGAVGPAAFWLAGRLASLDGESQSALEYHEEGVELATGADHLQAELFVRAGLLEGLVEVGQFERASDHAEWLERCLSGEIDASADASTQAWFQAYAKPMIRAHVALGRYERGRGAFEDALEAFEAGLAIAREQDDRLSEALLLFELARTDRLCDEASTDDHALARSESEVILENAATDALAIAEALGAFGNELQQRYADELAR